MIGTIWRGSIFLLANRALGKRVNWDMSKVARKDALENLVFVLISCKWMGWLLTPSYTMQIHVIFDLWWCWVRRLMLVLRLYFMDIWGYSEDFLNLQQIVEVPVLFPANVLSYIFPRKRKTENLPSSVGAVQSCVQIQRALLHVRFSLCFMRP